MDVGRPPHGRILVVTEREKIKTWIKVMTMERFKID